MGPALKALSYLLHFNQDWLWKAKWGSWKGVILQWIQLDFFNDKCLVRKGFLSILLCLHFTYIILNAELGYLIISKQVFLTTGSKLFSSQMYFSDWIILFRTKRKTHINYRQPRLFVLLCIVFPFPLLHLAVTSSVALHFILHLLSCLNNWHFSCLLEGQTHVSKTWSWLLDFTLIAWTVNVLLWHNGGCQCATIVCI